LANREQKIQRFTTALEMMFLQMQEVDNTCMEVSKDISKREFSLIVFVGKQQQVIMRDIADFLAVPMSTTTGIVDKMVEKGYIAQLVPRPFDLARNSFLRLVIFCFK